MLHRIRDIFSLLHFTARLFACSSHFICWFLCSVFQLSFLFFFLTPSFSFGPLPRFVHLILLIQAGKVIAMIVLQSHSVCLCSRHEKSAGDSRTVGAVILVRSLFCLFIWQHSSALLINIFDNYRFTMCCCGQCGHVFQLNGLMGACIICLLPVGGATALTISQEILCPHHDSLSCVYSHSVCDY